MTVTFSLPVDVADAGAVAVAGVVGVLTPFVGACGVSMSCDRSSKRSGGSLDGDCTGDVDDIDFD